MHNFFKKFFVFDVRATYRAIVESERDEINKRLLKIYDQKDDLIKRRDQLNEMLGYV